MKLPQLTSPFVSLSTTGDSPYAAAEIKDRLRTDEARRTRWCLALNRLVAAKRPELFRAARFRNIRAAADTPAEENGIRTLHEWPTLQHSARGRCNARNRVAASKRIHFSLTTGKLSRARNESSVSQRSSEDGFERRAVAKREGFRVVRL